MEIRRLKDIANAGNLSSEPVSQRSRPITEPSPVAHGEDDLSPEPVIDVMTRSFHGFPNSNNDTQEGEVDDCISVMEINMLDLLPYSPSLSADNSIVSYNSEEENAVGMETDPLFENSNLPIVSDDSVNPGHGCISSLDIDVCGLEVEATLASRLPADIVLQDSGKITEQGSQTSRKDSNVVSVPGNIVNAPSRQSNCVVDSSRVTPWAYTSIPGRRPEMEDAVIAVPGFFSLPCGVFRGCVARESEKASESSALHFYGVYDGHGGAQPYDFCRDRLHQALIEELQMIATGEGSIIGDKLQQSKLAKALGRGFGWLLEEGGC